MASIAFVLVLSMLAGTGLLYAASELSGQGYFWADQVCNAARSLCDHPYWAILATTAMGSLYVLAQAIEN